MATNIKQEMKEIKDNFLKSKTDIDLENLEPSTSNGEAELHRPRNPNRKLREKSLQSICKEGVTPLTVVKSKEHPNKDLYGM